jgi:hypothetical protein
MMLIIILLRGLSREILQLYKLEETNRCRLFLHVPYARYLNMFGLSLSRSKYSREMRSSMRFLMTLKSGCVGKKKTQSPGMPTSHLQHTG